MQQGFVQGPEKEGDVNVVHVSRPSSPLTPHCPFVLSVFNLRAALEEEFAGPENICIAPKAEQGAEQQNFKTAGF